jgi:acyl carrier protein
MDPNEVEAKLKEFICTELLRNPDFQLNQEDKLITGGLMDSFSLAQIGVFIEDEFDVYIPDTDLTVEKMDTISLMTTRVLNG